MGRSANVAPSSVSPKGNTFFSICPRPKCRGKETVRCVGFDNVHFKTLNGDTELRDDVKLVLFNEEMQFYVLVVK